jgi:hypothetical protein
MRLFRRKPRWSELLSVTISVLSVILAVWVMWQLRPAADGWDPNNMPGSICRVVLSDSPRMQAIRDAMANAYVDLEEQKRLARSEGLPLSAADVTVRRVSDERNAALPAGKLVEALREKPIPDDVKAVLDRAPASDADARVLAEFLKARPDLLPMVDAILARSDFSLNRTWTPDEIHNFTYERIAVLREGARLLRAQSFLLARSGDNAGAMAANRKALKLAAFSSSEDGLLAMLIGRATEATALQAMQFTLARRGASRGVAASAVQALRAMPAPASAVEAIRFECLDGYSRLPKDKLLTYPPGEPPVIPAPKGRNALSHGRLEAAALAEYLRQMRLAVAAVKAPDPMHSAATQELGRILSGEAPQVPQSLYADMLVPRVSRVLRKAAESQALRDVTLAAAEVLAHKARTGAFPAKLPSPGPTGPLRPAVHYTQSEDGFTVSATVRRQDFEDGYPEDTPDTTFRFEFPAKSPTP